MSRLEISLSWTIRDKTLIRDLKKKLTFWSPKIEKFLVNVLPKAEYPIELGLMLCGKHKIRRLNKQYRKIDRPTDVLSFPLFDKKEYVGGPILLGDIIIFKDLLQENAKNWGYTFHEEFLRLLVHGLLHLIGQDHDTPKQEKKMYNLQEKLISKIGNL